MDKDARKNVAGDTTQKDRETIIKILSDGAPVEIPINGEIKPVYWDKTGHTDRTYHKAYIKSKVLDAYNSGIMPRYSGEESIEIKTPKRFIIPEKISIIPESLVLTSDDEIVPPDTYTYHSDTAVIDFMDKGITGNFKLIYKYYDEESYQEFVDTFSTCLLIYLSVKERDDHDVRVFEKVRDVESLTLKERNAIITKYYDDIGITEEDLKNLANSDFFVEGDSSQKATESTPTEEKSGGNLAAVPEK